MTNDKADQNGDAGAERLDPKEAMRRALEAKQARQSDGEQHSNDPKVAGGPHGQAAAKRTFRRKSGG